MPRVLAACANTGRPIATYAQMKPRQFARFKGNLSVHCPECRQTHALPSTELWLEGGSGQVRPPGQEQSGARPDAEAEEQAARHAPV